MKKPNFNPLFYSYFIHGVSFGGGGKTTPSVTYTASAQPNTPESIDTGQEKVDPSQVDYAKRGCKTTRDSLVDKLKTTLREKDKSTYKRMRSKIDSYYSAAARRLNKNMTKEHFAREQAKIAKETREFNNKIEDLSEMLKHKELSKKELKKVTQSTIAEFQGLLMDERYRKNIEPKHLVYVASAYLLRWETENSKAIDRIYDLKTATRVYQDLQTKRGQAFKDLDNIKQDIMRVYDRWADAENDEDEREVYSDSQWDTKYEKTLPDFVKMLDAMPGVKFLTGLSYSIPLVAGAATPAASAVPFLFKKYKNKKAEELQRIFASDLKGYLKYAREQAKKGKFAPRPDMLRDDGARHKVRITAGINPEKIQRSIEFGNRAVEYRNKLAKAGRSENIGFSNPNMVQGKDEGTISINHKKKTIGNIKLEAGGKKYLIYKKEKIDITAKSAAEVIKQIQETALSPKITDMKVSKLSGRAKINIEGDNLPSDSTRVDLRAGAMNLSKVGSGKTNINLAPSFKTIEENMKSILKSSLTEYAEAQNPKLAKEIKPKITDKLLANLKEKVFPKSRKPRIVVTGKASLEGDWKRNQEIAKKRAEQALKELQRKNPELTKSNYDIRLVSIISGPDAKPVSSASDGWKKMKEAWNKDPKISDKVKTVAELKKKIKKAKSGARDAFVKRNFNDQRGADLLILPPANDDAEFDIEMGNQPTAPTASNPGAIT